MLTINTERFLSLMTAQAQIGKTAEGGVSRPALSLPDIEVRAWFEAEIKARRLAYQVDGAGNQITRLPCASPDAKTLILASHLDSVPDGGRFDGALGVLVAFETMLTLKEAGVNLPFHVEAVNFTDEEGNLLGLFGSRAMTGAITPEALCAPRGGRDGDRARPPSEAPWPRTRRRRGRPGRGGRSPGQLRAHPRSRPGGRRGRRCRSDRQRRAGWSVPSRGSSGAPR